MEYDDVYSKTGHTACSVSGSLYTLTSSHLMERHSAVCCESETWGLNDFFRCHLLRQIDYKCALVPGIIEFGKLTPEY